MILRHATEASSFFTDYYHVTSESTHFSGFFLNEDYWNSEISHWLWKSSEYGISVDQWSVIYCHGTAYWSHTIQLPHNETGMGTDCFIM